LNQNQRKTSDSKQLIIKLMDFRTEINNFSNKIETIEVERGDDGEIDWESYWFRMKREAPELSNVAIVLLSMGINEASVERLFSVQQLAHAQIRNRLEADIVEAEMIIRFNKIRKVIIEPLEEASDEEDAVF
jgi:hypothetical protein